MILFIFLFLFNFCFASVVFDDDIIFDDEIDEFSLSLQEVIEAKNVLYFLLNFSQISDSYKDKFQASSSIMEYLQIKSGFIQSVKQNFVISNLEFENRKNIYSLIGSTLCDVKIYKVYKDKISNINNFLMKLENNINACNSCLISCSKNINFNFFKNMKDVQSGIVIKESQDYYLIYSVYNIRNIQIILDQNIKDEILLQKIQGKIDFFFSVAPVWFDERLI